MALPIPAPEDDLMADGALAEGEAPSVEVELEVEPAAPEAETILEPVVEPAPEPAAPDMDAVVAELEAKVSGLTSERDIALGQASAAESALAALRAEVEPVRSEMAMLRVKLADYELGAALSAVGLPPQAGALVKQLYTAAVAGAARPQALADWLAISIEDPSSPVSALSLMRPAVAPGSDPRNGAQPVNGAGHSRPGLTPFPSFASPRR